MVSCDLPEHIRVPLIRDQSRPVVCVQEPKRTVKTRALRSCALTRFSEYGRKSADYEFDAPDRSSFSLFPSFSFSFCCCRFSYLWHWLGLGKPGAHRWGLWGPCPAERSETPWPAFPPEWWGYTPPPHVPFCLVDNLFQALLFLCQFQVLIFSFSPDGCRFSRIPAMT